MSNRMTRRYPLCCAEVALENGATIDIYKQFDEPAIATGTVVDRLYEYEHLGSVEYFKKLVEKERFERARRIAINSIYGTGLKIGKADQMKAIENLDISRMYPKMMFTPDYYARYIEADVEATRTLWEKVNPNLKKSWGKPALPEIDRVIFNNPATIVFWKDDTKTVVKTNNGDPYDPEKGLAMAMVKKVSGNKGNYYNTIRKELDKNPYDNSEVCHVKDYANMYHCLKQCEVNVRNSYANLVGVLNNKKATKADLIEAIELSVGRLGELLDDGGPLD